MTTALVLGCDAAYPFDYNILPTTVQIVLGYLGGDTPHAWSLSEADEVRAAGRTFAPIWTAPSTGQVLTAGQGHRDAIAFLQELITHGVETVTPCFYDIEHDSFVASQSGAFDALAQFKATLNTYGYPVSYGYLPWSTQHDWVAKWGVPMPTQLPNGVIGWQYANAQAGGKYDLSVFDPTIWEGHPMVQPTDPGIVAILTALSAIYSDPAHQWSNENIVGNEHQLLSDAAAIKAELDKVAANSAPAVTQATLQAALAANGVTGAGVAAQIIKQLTPPVSTNA